MERFKQLNWSWYKYEEERKQSERAFSFETIHDDDPLVRNLNEIHKAVLPKSDEYRLFKTPEEIAANSIGNHKETDIREVKDPRKITHSLLKPSHELIKDLRYTSELKKNEQISILNALEDKSIHNPKLLKRSKFTKRNESSEISNLNEKWMNEATHYNKCAEIYFHRHVSDLNNLLSEDLKLLLIEEWSLLENDLRYSKYQVITQIPRTSIAKAITEINQINESSQRINCQFYTISESFFPNLQNHSIENLEFYLNQKKKSYRDFDAICDIQISLNSLTKLCINGNEFNASFVKNNGLTNFLHDEALPSKIVSCSEALEEALKLILVSTIEYQNAEKFMKLERNDDEFIAVTISDFMKKIYTNYKNHAGNNSQFYSWSLNKGSQKLSVGIRSEVFFISENDKVVISIKCEYQTKFGAEQMTKDELIKEWIQLKFSGDCHQLRYRIDAKSMQIISITKLTIEEIENELRENYNYSCNDSLDVLFNIFNCIRSLPDSHYLIQAKNEDDFNRLLIFKECDDGKELFDESIQISQTFIRKFIPIDRKVVTFLHLNEFLPPCCFPIQKSSYKSSYLTTKATPSSSSKAKKAKNNIAVKQQLPLKKRLRKRKPK